MKKLLLLFLLVSGFVYGQSSFDRWVPTTGTDTYATFITAFPGSYSNTQAYLKFGNTNTGAATININTLGPANLRRWDGDSWELLSAGQIDVNTIYKIAYNGSYFTMESFASGSGTFQGLTDGPGSFTGNALEYFRVNAGETALEYRTPTQVRSDIGAGIGDALTTNPLSQFAATTSAQLRGVLSDELGTGAALFDGATPTSFIGTNITGVPISTGVSGLGTGVATFLGTPSWTNFNTMITGTAPFYSLSTGGARTATNTFTGNFAVYFSEGTFGIGHSSQTASTTLDVRGTGTGSTTFSFFGRNSGNVRTIAARDDGALIFGSSGNGLISRTTDGSSVNVAGNGFLLLGDSENSGNISAWNVRSGSVANSSGTKGLMTLVTNFAPSAGTATWSDIKGQSIINQTGSSSGAVDLINYTTTLTSVLGPLSFLTYNPTVTSVSGAHYGFRIVPATQNSVAAGLSPTAKLHIGASATGASTASIKINEGSRQTTPEDGTLNYVSNNLEFVETSTVHILPKTLTGSGTLDFDLTAVDTQDLTITVTGAADGDKTILGIPSAAFVAGVSFTYTTTAANTVTVRCSCITPVCGINPGSGTFKASVIKD